MVKSSDKTWSAGEENGKLLQHSCLENLINSAKGQKDTTLKDEPSPTPRLVGVQCANREERRNNSRRNDEAWRPWCCQVMDVSGGKIKVQCCKE